MSPEELEQELKRHQESRPDPTKFEQYDDFHKWNLKKDSLVRELEVRRAIAKPVWIGEDGQVRRGILVHYGNKTGGTGTGKDYTGKRKTGKELNKLAATRVEEMGSMKPGTIEWRVARASAVNYLSAARRRAIEDEDSSEQEVPIVPRMEKAAIQLGRPTKSAQSIVDGMVKRLERYRAEGRRRHATSLKATIRGLCDKKGLRYPEAIKN